MRSLTPKQQRFVAEYIVDLNATRAAVRAGYSAKTARWIGPRLVTKSHVSVEIAAYQSRMIDRIDLSAADTLEELRRILHFDPGEIFDEAGGMRPIHELPPEVRSCIASVETKELVIDERVVGRVTKLKFWNKMAAISKAMDHFNLAGGSLASLPTVVPAEQEARAAETKAQLEALLKAKESLWHRSSVMPINTPPRKIGLGDPPHLPDRPRTD